jgi:ABC-2 type transport system ATP-binding protein
LQVQPGEIYGFIGPNGAGKTSTIRILCTLLAPTAGDAFVGGYSVTHQRREVRALIGYMPDFFGIYPDLTVYEYLAFFAGCYELSAKDKEASIPALLELVDLASYSDLAVEKLSRGMKQRLSLARTLIHNPQVLILDEPASGLDPRARVEIRELLRELASMGKTIFFTSHILSDVSEICTRIGIIDQGKLIASDTPAKLSQLLIQTRKIRIGLLNGADMAHQVLSNFPGVSSLTPIRDGAPPYEYEFELAGELEDVAALHRQLVEANVALISFREMENNLEEIYLRTTRNPALSTDVETPS